MLGREHAVGHPALTDQETGLANRLHFELVYRYLFGAGDRGVALTVMLLHVAGVDSGHPDAELLRAIGERLQGVTRGSDLVSHPGGGRFVILLLGSNLQGGLLAADRVQTAVAEVTRGAISVGLAAYSPEMKESSQLLDAADEALRQAQGTGGGIEVVHT
jgi:diguanylate cyclase (GGDEF)-like protein